MFIAYFFALSLASKATCRLLPDPPTGGGCTPLTMNVNVALNLLDVSISNNSAGSFFYVLENIRLTHDFF